MLLEIVILMEIVAFVFLALGLIPFGNNGKSPLINKTIFMFVATIIFFMMAITAVNYDYTYCYINETVYDAPTTSTFSIAACDNLKIENQGLAYLNYGMGIVSILLIVIILLIAGITGKDELMNESEENI
jgi:hypothetical protein